MFKMIFLPLKSGSACNLGFAMASHARHGTHKLEAPTMEFQIGNQHATIKGDLALGRSLVSLKTMYKTLLAEKKNGFLVELNMVEKGMAADEEE